MSDTEQYFDEVVDTIASRFGEEKAEHETHTQRINMQMHIMNELESTRLLGAQKKHAMARILSRMGFSSDQISLASDIADITVQAWKHRGIFQEAGRTFKLFCC